MPPIAFSRHASLRLRILSLQNFVACSYFLVMTVIATLMAWIEILPHFYNKQAMTMTLHKSAVAFLFVNVIGNFLLCVLTNTNTRKLQSGSNHYSTEMCADCKLPRPDRAHHCKLCQSCILKRDHHCFFMTVCIGYNNQKHFIMYNFYMSLGAFYAVVLHAKYLHSLFGTRFNGPQTFVLLLFDLIRDLTSGKYPSTYYSFLILVLYSGLIMGVISIGFFFWQMAISISGQTTYEAWRGDETYSAKSIGRNLGDVFGRGWPLVLLLPIPFAQTGNGVYESIARAARAGHKMKKR